MLNIIKREVVKIKTGSIMNRGKAEAQDKLIVIHVYFVRTSNDINILGVVNLDYAATFG